MGESISIRKSLETRVLHADSTDLGHFEDPASLETWLLPTDESKLAPLHEAATLLKSSSVPIGFPTETVYGLGADATRSEAVKGIYSAKGRPSDNPLIIHVSDLTMLRSLLVAPETDSDPLPVIYLPLIKKFWPGPLTILLPNPVPSKLAPEVTAGLPSFGARMPSSPLALSLIHLAGVPLAAPSANASTKPSPTTAAHVLHDLGGSIELILDGGACSVGVESTVVDGLCNPPVVLRPGGVSIDLIRECEGWEGVVRGYKDASEIGSAAPRAPGMKYKHYSPKAKVVLYETSSKGDVETRIWQNLNHKLGEGSTKFGFVRTKQWDPWVGLRNHCELSSSIPTSLEHASSLTQGELRFASSVQRSQVIEISLGKETKGIARGLFSALRELDQRAVDVIYVEGIEDEGDIAAAVMNRLRKAASVIEK